MTDSELLLMIADTLADILDRRYRALTTTEYNKLYDIYIKIVRRHKKLKRSKND